MPPFLVLAEINGSLNGFYLSKSYKNKMNFSSKIDKANYINECFK